MQAIFISYRRHDSEGEAGRLFDELVDHFGNQSVFMDVAAIEAGRDFRKVIDESIASCGVLLAVIGPGWLDERTDRGARRLDEAGDFVRAEVASALRREIPVVPVLVHGATMPRTEQLPADLADLAYRNSVELTHVRWKSDVQVLIASLRSLLGEVGQHLAARPATAAEPSPAIDPAALTTVTKDLARYIGPIAGVIVKRAASQCGTVADLRRMVAEEIDNMSDRKAFLATLS